MQVFTRLSVLLCAVFVCISANVWAMGIGSASVKFGSPEAGGGCDGKGVCMLSSMGAAGSEEYVNVIFTLLEDPAAGFYTLSLQFNISEMSSANHDYLYQHFLYPDSEPRPRFLFDKAYTIKDDELCRALNIQTGSVTIPQGPESCGQDNNIEKLNDADIRLTFIIPME